MIFRWGSLRLKKRLANKRWLNPFSGSSQAKGLVTEKVGVGAK